MALYADADATLFGGESALSAKAAGKRKAPPSEPAPAPAHKPAAAKRRAVIDSDDED